VTLAKPGGGEGGNRLIPGLSASCDELTLNPSTWVYVMHHTHVEQTAKTFAYFLLNFQIRNCYSDQQKDARMG